MNTVTQLARHALDHGLPVTLFGIRTKNQPSLSHFTHMLDYMEDVHYKTCLILDAIQTFSSPSWVVAQDIAEKFNGLQNKIQSHGGCLALASQEMNSVCLLYPPTASVELDVERFYSADIALLVRALFPPTHSIIQWLDHTESHIQKQRISNHIQINSVSSRKKL